MPVDGGIGRNMSKRVRVATAGALIGLHQDVTNRDGTQTVYSIAKES